MAWLFLSLALISATEVLPSWDLVCFNTASIPSSQNLVKIMSNRDHGPCVTKLAPKSLWPSISHWTHGAHHFLEWTSLSECLTHKDQHESNLKHVATALSLVLELPLLTSTVGSQRLRDAFRLHCMPWSSQVTHSNAPHFGSLKSPSDMRASFRVTSSAPSESFSAIGCPAAQLLAEAFHLRIEQGKWCGTHLRATQSKPWLKSTCYPLLPWPPHLPIWNYRQKHQKSFRANCIQSRWMEMAGGAT